MPRPTAPAPAPARRASASPARPAAPPDAGVFPLQCTGARVRRLARRITTFYETHMRRTGLKLSQYSVLAHLSDRPQSLLQLAERLELDRTTLTRGLRPLIANGWVAEVRSRDARQRLLVLTPAGKQFRKKAHQSWKAAQLALEKQLGPELVIALHGRLDRVLAQLKPALPDEN